MEKTILVIGATGKLGEPTARRLKEDGYKVRIMARDREKVEKMFDQSFEIVIGDVTDTDILEKSMNGCSGIHISLNPPDIEQLGVENIVSIASKEELERITYISGTNAFDENAWFHMTNNKLLAEKAIRESGIPYTIFCPTYTMENLPDCIQGTRAVILGKQPDPYHILAGEDFARMASKAYGLDEAVNKRLFIHGPEAVHLHDALRRYCSAFHQEIKKITTMPFWFANFMGTITGDKDLKFWSEVSAFFEKVGEGGAPAEANNILGAPEITLDKWIEKRRE